MEFTIKSDELVKALNTVKGTFGNKNFPALNNIYFEADANGEVTIKASNANETTKTKVTANVVTDGKVLIDGYTMTKVVNTFADGDVTIKTQASSFGADVTHPTGELEVAGSDPDDFVNPAEIAEESSFMIPSKEFKSALESVAFAKATNHTNNKLNGVAIVIDNGRTTLFASDTTRVAKYVFDTPAAADINIVVGPEIIKGLGAVTGNIAVRLATGGVLLETNESSYQGTVMTTNFPPQVNNYFLLPAHATTIVQKEALKDVLTRVSILSKAGKDEANADFTFKDTGELEIQFKGTRGRIKSEKVTTSHSGPDVTLKLNVDKILESVNKIDKDNIEIVFPQGKNNTVKALNIFPEGNKDYGIFNMGVSS
jgi:DNA polymerase III sliding clamp (beta) subunit (PCNA family)